ncbi:MAG: hypothetical protein HZA35_03610 [Parcubacteria group bacterium]|nr:hypothetical protein [Parcubacteria group bacterium]
MRILKFFSVGTILLSLLSPLSIFAQTPTPTPPAQKSFAPPVQVYVIEETLNNAEFRGGDTIKGSFKFVNRGDENIPEVYYHLSLMGDYDKNDAPGVIYDQKTYGPFFLHTQETKPIDFEYTLPKGISGDHIGIHISTFLKTGLFLGWSQSFIKIQGETHRIDFSKVSLAVDKNEFDPETGPAVYKGKQITYNVTLFNPSTDTITFTPTNHYI